jgi:hypothetical protein
MCICIYIHVNMHHLILQDLQIWWNISNRRKAIRPLFIYILFKTLRVRGIDISWLDGAYKSSTCDVMYRRQRRHLYYFFTLYIFIQFIIQLFIYIMVVKFRNTIWPPPPQLSLHRRVALSSSSNGTPSYIAERTQNAVYIVRCLWWEGGGAHMTHAISKTCNYCLW